MDIRITLTQLGLSPKEADVYLTTLELGMSPASVIARKSKIKRTTVHEILARLSEKGLVEYFMRKHTRYFSVLSPKSLVEKYESHVADLRSSLPSLLAVENRIVGKPKVSFFEGKEDLKRLYLDPLNQSDEVLNYFDPAKVMEYFGEPWLRDSVIKTRAEHKIPVRVIMPDSALSRRFKERGAKELRTARIITDAQIYFPNEIYIYGNRFSIFSFSDDMAMLIESADVVKTQRAIFELAWSSVKVQG
ncbi:MAG: helix-turn-helix domain-containing protein [Candidatus Peribacteraceae bacterium]|nr:helix-turn-helix domain-containing protein [Candidatus Peribacteraceae bacterium]